jgi:MFS family permease
MAEIVQTIPKENIGQGFGIYGVALIGSQAIAPAIGIYISEHFGFSALFHSVSALLFLLFIPALALKSKFIPAGEHHFSLAHKSFFAKEVWGFAVLAWMFMMGATSVGNFIVIFGEKYGIGEVGLYYIIQVGILIVTRIFAGPLIDKIVYQHILYPCIVLCVIGIWLISLAQSFSLLAVAAVLMGFGLGLSNPTVQTALIKRVESSRQGIGSATYNIGVDSALLCSSLLMGLCAEYADYRTGFRVMSIPILSAAPLTMYLTGKEVGANCRLK